jgi:hypothetical protein
MLSGSYASFGLERDAAGQALIELGLDGASMTNTIYTDRMMTQSCICIADVWCLTGFDAVLFLNAGSAARHLQHHARACIVRLLSKLLRCNSFG